MSKRRLRAIAVVLCACSALLASGVRAEPALVEIGNLVLRADGSFKPRALPKRHFAPIDFQGRVEIAAKDGGRPSPLEKAVVDFDRDSRLTPGALPVCPPELIAEAAPEQARQLCGGAIVGGGHVRALLDLASGPAEATSMLTLFNGPRREDTPTVVLHAQMTVPSTQTFALVIPIERRRGRFRYRATLAVPPIAGGLGAITHIDATVGRRFSVDGQPRSYIAARCSDGVIHTHGRFTFADGTAIDGSVEKPCDVRRAARRSRPSPGGLGFLYFPAQGR